LGVKATEWRLLLPEGFAPFSTQSATMLGMQPFKKLAVEYFGTLLVLTKPGGLIAS
jgi:hypothetical protein